MIDIKDGVQFDPGFIQHISAFEPNIEYVYNTLSTCRNFNQKKMQFKMFYPKIQSLLKNYLGFYLGCILWAVYIVYDLLRDKASKTDNIACVINYIFLTVMTFKS